MVQTASVIGLKLGLALLAAIPVLTTLGVYLVARFTSALDAYAGEGAKLLAQFHNIDKLVEQNKTLTATTEAIKSRMSDEVWDRQQRWNARLEYYRSLFQVLSEIKEATYHFGWNEFMMGDKPLERISRQLNPPEEDKKWNEALAKANVDLRQLLLFGELVVGERGRICIGLIRQAVKPDRDNRGTENPRQRLHERLEGAISDAVVHAKTDLGYGTKDDDFLSNS